MLIGGLPSSRDFDDNPQSAHRAFIQRHVAAMAAGDVADDGKAKAGARGIEVARLVQSEKRLEYILA